MTEPEEWLDNLQPPPPPLPRTTINVVYPKLWIIVLVVFITVLITNLIWLAVVEPLLAPEVAERLQTGEAHHEHINQA
jgi:hypothetical protein